MFTLKSFIIYFLFSSILSAQQTSSFRFCEDFQSGDFSQGYRNKEITVNNGYEVDTTSNKGRFDDGFLKKYMNESKNRGAKRSEYGFRLYDSIGYTKFFALSFKLPKRLKFDKENLGKEIMISQWHSKPAPYKDWNHYRKYNPFNRPSIALYITTNDNKNFYVLLRYGNNGKNEFEFKSEVWSIIALKKIKQEEWYDIAFEIKWSFQNDGYIASWIDNKPFTPFNGYHNKIYGANMHNKSPAYFKFGQYKYWDDSHRHEVYFDELRVGNSLDEVSMYDKLPTMFLDREDINFVENHK